MAKLTVDEFLERYERNPDLVFQRLEKDQLKIEDLFTSLDKLLLLYNLLQKKLTNVSRKKQSEEMRLARIAEQNKDMDKILEKSAEPLARLYTNYGEFIAAAGACSAFGAKLFAKAPEIIAPLFTQYRQLMLLHGINPILAKDILLKRSTLVTRSEEFLDLNEKNAFIAEALFNKEPQRIADLLNKEDLITVAKIHPNLATKIGIKKNAPPLTPKLSRARLKLKNEPLPNLDTADESTPTNDQSLSKSTQKISNSFLFQCLAALGTGLATILVGVLLAQPIAVIAGFVISGLSTLTLCGIFSKNTPKDAPNKLRQEENLQI